MTEGNKKQEQRRSGRPSGQRRRSGSSSRKSQPRLQTRGEVSHLGVPLQDGRYVVFDIETTGGNPTRNGITEIFARRYHGCELKDSFYSMVNPGVPIPSIVRRMTGITNRMVRKAPPIQDVMPDFVRFVGQDVLVSHNTIGDMKFLRHFAEQTTGSTMLNYYLCTHLLTEKIFPHAPDKSLSGLAEWLELPAEGDFHRAEADAGLTLELFKKLMEKLLEKKIPDISSAIRYQGDYESGLRLGWGISPGVLDGLPSAPGVLYLRDFDGEVRFVSSAFDLRKEARKLQRYQSLPRQLLKVVLSTAGLEFTETGSGFEATLEEARALDRHNRALDPGGWHQRSANFLFLAGQGKESRLSTGPIPTDTRLALGPIRSGRDVGRFMENLADILDSRLTRKGIRLDAGAATALERWLEGDQRDAVLRVLVDRLRMLLPSHRDTLLRAGDVLRSLDPLILPPELKSLTHCSGVLSALNKDGSWNLYPVIRGVAGQPLRVTDDPPAVMESRRGTALLARVRRSRQKSARTRLSRLETRMANRVFWWVFFGLRKGEGQFFPLEG